MPRFLKSYMVDPPYYFSEINYDACKVYLKSKLDLRKKEVSAIPLCKKEPKRGTCVISGWGATDRNGQVGADVLQKLSVRIVPRAQCKNIYSSAIEITDAMICAISTPGRSACKPEILTFY